MDLSAKAVGDRHLCAHGAAEGVIANGRVDAAEGAP